MNDQSGEQVRMSLDPLRVEMLLPSLPRAGMEVVAATLAGALRARGHDVGFTCVMGPGELGEELRAAGFRVSVVPAPGLRPNLFASELGPWFRALAPNIVHVHNGVWLKAVQGARQAGVSRTVYTLHGIDIVEPWYLRYLNRAAARHTTRIVTVSDSLRGYMVETLGVPPSVVSVIPNGVSTSRFHPGNRSVSVREALGVPAGRTIIGTVARLDPVKNHRLLLDAFSRVRQTRRDAFLLIVGDGVLRAEIEERIDALGLRADTLITGLRPDPAPILKEIDIFALSSDIEGTSISILEAMSTGLPVIATAVGGTPALLRDGQCGVLTPPGDVPALARALLDLISDPDRARALGARARREVEEHHSVERMTDLYEATYAASASAAPNPAIAK
jgi:glycosyltransferase involved in cell wall biosynthesis